MSMGDDGAAPRTLAARLLAGAQEAVGAAISATARQQLAALDVLALARTLRRELEGRVEGGIRALYDVLGIGSKEDLEELRGARAALRGEVVVLRQAMAERAAGGAAGGGAAAGGARDA